MLEYVNELWQAFLNRPDFWAVLSIIPVTAFVTWAHVWMALKWCFIQLIFGVFMSGLFLLAGKVLCRVKPEESQELSRIIPCLSGLYSGVLAGNGSG